MGKKSKSTATTAKLSETELKQIGYVENLLASNEEFFNVVFSLVSFLKELGLSVSKVILPADGVHSSFPYYRITDDWDCFLIFNGEDGTVDIEFPVPVRYVIKSFDAQIVESFFNEEERNKVGDELFENEIRKRTKRAVANHGVLFADVRGEVSYRVGGFSVNAPELKGMSL